VSDEPGKSSLLWSAGEVCALRGLVRGRLWTAQAALVVKDTPEEIALALLPGAQCFYPASYVRRRKGELPRGTRWEEARAPELVLEERTWETNQVLMLAEPGRFYSVFHFRDAASGEFRAYYVNFELPWTRSHCGFDTLDLDLDLVVAPDLSWHWKDEADYTQAVEAGDICRDWANGVENARADLLQRIAARAYPFDGTWVAWRPDAGMSPPRLPQRWQRICK
jgi:hypothetical protein